jgi:hypothetical protein
MRSRFTLGLTGLVHVPSRPDVRPAGSGHDLLEVDGLDWWPWTISEVLGRIRREGGWRIFVPLGAAALALARANDFGEGAVRSEWRRLTDGR